jgi:cytochrome d ubiquinol oxidase subunit II
VIDHSIGPVWEANHVWLIFVFVVLWTSFPEAYQSIWITLWVPLALAALGIVLRGSSFAFRHALLTTRDRRAAGAVFATSSVLVPFFLGTVAGGIASGRVPAGGEPGDVDAWINPTSVLGGVLAVCATAFLSATYLVWDARRLEDERMVGYFRRRAFGAAVASGVVAVVGIFVLRADSEYVFDGLASRALPFVIISAAAGLVSLWLLRRDDPRGARLSAVAAVASIVVGWGVAQWDYMLPETLTVDEAAAPSATLEVILLVTVIAGLIVFPAIGWLFVMAQRGLLPEEGVDEVVE